ncbi:hypothetical protein J2S78_000728 [Salibacterium salarium]|nr:hypothetical protein [Salibacterium salarium]
MGVDGLDSKGSCLDSKCRWLASKRSSLDSKLELGK